MDERALFCCYQFMMWYRFEVNKHRTLQYVALQTHIKNKKKKKPPPRKRKVSIATAVAYSCTVYDVQVWKQKKIN